MYLQSRTGQRIKRVQADNPGASIDFIVRAVWPSTQQPEKKARTVRKYLRGFEREAAHLFRRREQALLAIAFDGYPRLAQRTH